MVRLVFPGDAGPGPAFVQRVLAGGVLQPGVLPEEGMGEGIGRGDGGGEAAASVRSPVLLCEGDERLRIVQDAGVLLQGAPARRLESPQGGVQTHTKGP